MQSQKVGVPLEEGRVLGTKVFSVGCSDDGDGDDGDGDSDDDGDGCGDDNGDGGHGGGDEW